MRLTWPEIRARAAAFARDWQNARHEKGETQSFYNAFFAVFGIDRRRVAAYEVSARRIKGSGRGFIDLFWPGVLLVEQKSAGRDLWGAEQQALDYLHGLSDAELPRFVLVSDFRTLHLRDLTAGTVAAFPLADLPRHVEAFGFMLGRQPVRFRDQDPVNIRAAELVGHLHDLLEASRYTGHRLEVFLTRIVFLLFADDTGIIEPKDTFFDWLESETAADGSDLGPKLAALFDALNTPEDARQTTLDAGLARFPYVNGHLFAEYFPPPAFDAAMRAALLNAARFDWTPISPAIFGALFQSVMDPSERRRKGAHYTTEANILKVIGPLFMDALRAEFARARTLARGREAALRALHERLAGLTFLDPACGCGNFLVIAYRELRRLEHDLLEALRGTDQRELDAAAISRVDVNQFHGIEFEEFPARIAETALWMMDHLMNRELSERFGNVFVRIPLKAAPTILANTDALMVDWAAVLPPDRCSFILGNPPFIGHQQRKPAQVAGMHRVWGREGQFNRLDYVTAWFRKAIDYAAGAPHIRIGFVATNSITQGEQAGILWPWVFRQGWHIAFGHRTFQWTSEARGKAAVHCVIVGLSPVAPPSARVFEYDRPDGEATEAVVTRLNGYLVDGPQWSVPARSRPQAGQKPIHKGSQPTDGGRQRDADGSYVKFSNLILEAADAARLRVLHPELDPYLRPYVGGDELINGDWRFCLWLKDAPPQLLRGNREVAERLARVRAARSQSATPSVRGFAEYPTLFTQDRQPDVAYLAIPEVSSEGRAYIPMAMLPASVIASNKLMIMPRADLRDFALLTSRMHMAWMRTVAGRLKSDYSYAPSVWFTFPLPAGDLAPLEPLAQAILDARAAHPGATLADLYDPDLMPENLRRAHKALDRAVDRLYRPAPFAGDRERVEHLFARYEAMAAPLLPAATAPRRRRKT